MFGVFGCSGMYMCEFKPMVAWMQDAAVQPVTYGASPIGCGAA
jgi:hypothetical protein